MKQATSLAGKVVIGSILAWMALPTALADVVLYGGLGGHGVSSGPQASTNDGSLAIVSQTNGSTTVIGHPDGVARISGLAFGLDGTLFGATQVAGGFPPPPGPPNPASDLIVINPDTGELISSRPISASGTPISIADLAVHPTTGILYGTGGVGGAKINGAGTLYTINTATGAATLIGDTGFFFGSIVFAPDGTLYMSAASLGDRPVDPFLLTLNQTNAAILARVPTADFYHSLAVRPTDGVMFGGTADQQGVYTIDPATGASTLIGMTSAKDFVGDLAFRPVAGPPVAVDLNQHGLTGSWYKQVTSGQGVEVEVFANPASGTGSSFVSWFTYDSVVGGAERQRWYTAQGQVVTGQPTASLTIYQNTGGNFDAPPVTNAQAVGTATLSFDTCTSGQLGYNFSDGTGRTGTIPLTRLTQNVTCSMTAPYPSNADFALSGNWFGGAATSGQGVTAEVNPISGAFFAAWYTYMPNGIGAGAAGQRWYTAQGAFTAGMRSIPVTIYETTGGMFDAPTTPVPQTVQVGTGTMAFQSCTAATLSYTFTGGTSMGLAGTLNLIRVGPVPPGCTM